MDLILVLNATSSALLCHYCSDTDVCFILFKHDHDDSCSVTVSSHTPVNSLVQTTPGTNEAQIKTPEPQIILTVYFSKISLILEG